MDIDLAKYFDRVNHDSPDGASGARGEGQASAEADPSDT